MNKIPLGIVIPYYKNSEQCESFFKLLMEKISKQVNVCKNALLLVVEDGQESDWLNSFENDQIKIFRNKENKGVSNARNQGIEYFKDKCNYITFIDSDDDIADDYVKVLSNYAGDNTHEVEVLETKINVNGVENKGFEPKKHRNAVWSYALKFSIIEDKRFDETLQFGEDTDFLHRVIDLNKQRKICVPTVYYYHYGRNPNSLAKMFNEKRIDKKR